MGLKPVAFVTGGQGGIGRAINARLVTAGYRVVSADVVNSQSGEPIGAKSPEIVLRHIDVTRTETVQQAFMGIGALAALVNCAGILRAMPPDRFDESASRLMFEVNLLGAARVTSVALRHLIDGGAIVNISSIAPRLMDQAETALYAATKAGLEAYTRHTAHALAPRKIRVNAIAPGIIDVEMTEAMRAVAYSDRSPLTRCPAGRMGTAEEVAECVEFLLSNRASYVNGTTLIADGGIVGC